MGGGNWKAVTTSDISAGFVISLRTPSPDDLCLVLGSPVALAICLRIFVLPPSWAASAGIVAPRLSRPKPLASRTCGADSRARSIESKACEGALAIGQEPRLPIFSGRFCEVCCPHRERPGTRSTQRNKSHCHTTDSGPDVRVLDFSGSCVAYLCPGTLNSISVVYGAVRRRRGRLHPRGDSLAVFFVVGYCFSKIFR